MTTKLSINNLTSETLAWISGPRITSVQITDGNYNVIDDTAANAGSIGYILINGNDFDLNPQVLIDTFPVTTLTRVSNSLIRAQIPALNSASFNIQVINSDGSSAILVNGLTYSTFPAWITGSSLSSKEGLVPINIQLSANDTSNSAITYALAAANTLPTGAILYSNGYIQGNIAVNSNTTYNFTVVATDAQNQDTGRAFSLPTTLNTPPAWLSNQPNVLPVSQPIAYYSNTIVATDPAIASYIVTSGSLPPGLTLDAGTGVIAGQTSVNNSGSTYSFIVTATDTAGFSAARTFNITVGTIGFNSVTLSLKTNDVNTANNHAFIDSSINNFPITRLGDATQGTFTPFSADAEKWSVYFNGSSGIRFADNAALQFGTSAFTVQGWFLVNSAPSNDTSVISKWVSGNDNNSSWMIDFQSSNLSAAISIGGTVTRITASSGLPLGVWNHFALVRSGSPGTLSLFMNGARIATGTPTGSLVDDTNSVGLGIRGGTDGQYLTGYLTNIRVDNGTAVFDPTLTTYTVPTTVLPTVANTKLLTCQNNIFKDNSSNSFAPTCVGAPSIQSFSPFSPTSSYSPSVVGGSYYGDGTGDAIYFQDTTQSGTSSSFNLGAGNNASVDHWWYPTAAQTTAGFSKQVSVPTDWNGQIWYQINLYDSGNISLYYRSGANFAYIAAALPSNYLNQWNHVAIASDTSNNLSIFFNGVRIATTNATIGLTSTTPNYITFGQQAAGQTASSLQGYMAGLRFIQGSGAYNAASTTITIPTAPPTATATTQLLLNCTNAGIYDTTSKNNFQTGTNAQVSTSRAKYNNSSIAITPTSSASASTRAITPRQPNPGYIFGTGDFTVEMWVYLNGYGTNTRLYDGRPGANGAYLAIQVNTGGFSGTTNALQIYVNSAVQIDAGTTAPLDQWFHLAVCRSSSSTKMFVNGTQVGSTYSDTTNYLGGSATQPVPVIGASEDGNNAMNGNIDGVRIIKRALYTTNFTPPAVAFGLI
jgi:hypothetical protein